MAYRDFDSGYNFALRQVKEKMEILWKKYENDTCNIPKPDFISAYALITAMIEE